MNQIYYILFISVMLMMQSACLQTKVIVEEALSISDEGSTTGPEEDSVKILDGLVKTVESKAKALMTLQTDVETEFKNVVANFTTVENIDLQNSAYDITVNDSKTYHDFLRGSKALLKKISDADLGTQITTIEDLVSDAATEQGKLSDSHEVRKRVGTIKNNGKIAKDAKETLEEYAGQLKTKEQQLLDKILDAAKNFRALSGQRKVVALDDVIARIPAQKSLADIKTLLEDPKFFNLKAEIAAVPRHGQDFLDLYEVIAPYQGIVPREIARAIGEAKRLFDAFEAKLNSIPADHIGVDRIAREFDLLLGTATLASSVASMRSLAIEKRRSAEMLKILGNSPGLEASLNSYINGIKGNSPTTGLLYEDLWTNANPPLNNTGAARSKFNRAFLPAGLAQYYDVGNFQLIRNAALAAADPASPLHLITYQGLIDGVKGFRVEEIKEDLRFNGANRGTSLLGPMDTGELLKNIQQATRKKMQNKIAAVLINKSVSLVEKRLADRLSFLKNAIKSLPLVREINNDLTQYDKPPKLLAIELQQLTKDCVQKCIDLAAKGYLVHLVDDMTLGNNNICSQVEKEYFTLHPNLILAPVRYLPPPPDPAAAAPGPLDGRNIKFRPVQKAAMHLIAAPFLGALFEVEEAKTLIDFEIAVNKLNGTLNPAYRVNLLLLPNTHAFTVTTLIDDIGHLLSTEKIHTAGGNKTYAEIIDAFEQELDPNMTTADIRALGEKIKANSGEVVENLRFTLYSGPEGHYKIKNLFEPTADAKKQQIADTVKKTLLGTVMNAGADIGIPALQAALNDMKNAHDDQSSRDAITKLAALIKTGPPDNYRAQALALATPGYVFPAQTPAAQLSYIKTEVQANAKYKALAKLAKFKIDVDAAALKIEKIDLIVAPDSLESIANNIPPSLKNVIFRGGVVIDAAGRFNLLKDALTRSLQDLRAHAAIAGPVVADEPFIKPMVNAFSLMFSHILDELEKLPYNDGDNAKIKELYDQINTTYVDKFDRFKSTVRSKNRASNVIRPVIAQLNALLIKLNGAATTDAATLLIINEIKDDFIKKFLN